MSVVIFLAAIVAANLSVARFGPWSTTVTAFVLIGLDITLRDKIHEKWHGKHLLPKMAALIMAGGVISYLLNAGAGRIAIASTVAFAVSATMDTLVYGILFKRRRLLKMNASNIASAATDSVLFPTLAFGVFMPWIILGQFAAKVGGGFLWSLLISKRHGPEVPRRGESNE